VREKRFREDLFFRLYVVPVRIPPLRERPEDIPPLVEHLLKTMSPPGKPRAIKAAALKRLTAHSWPGNVRELKTTLQRAMVFAREADLDLPHISFTPLSSPAERAKPLDGAERDIIVTALRKHKGNRVKVAEELGIGRSTLFEKMKRLDIALDEHEQ
jgi:DNA-binding NtrC family response regulator